MELWKNIPIVLILLPLLISPLLAALKSKYSKILMPAAAFVCCVLSAALLVFCAKSGNAYTISMGEIGAPFGNELYISTTEAAVSLLFNLIVLLSVLAGMNGIKNEIHLNRQNLFFTVSSLLLTAANAEAFTNDLFTGYVFLEILTIAAGALIFIRSREGALFASMRYMLMNLLGSGLFLFGLTIYYCLTGELLFPQLKEAAARIFAEGTYVKSMNVSLLMMTLGLGIKSALYPFHTWLPNAYSGATPAASSMLSSVVCKAYIFLLIKLIARGVGIEVYTASGAGNIILVYSAIAIILGSIDAIREHNVRRMVSYSSVAQIGYIFMAASLGSRFALSAAVFHILAHSAAKAMLFPAVDRLTSVSGGNENFRDLRGSGFRAPLSGLAFTVGAFSITGIPFLGGFTSKLFIASAAVDVGSYKLCIVLLALAVSTVLNVVYFLRTVVTLYRRGENYPLTADKKLYPLLGVALVCFIAINLALGVLSSDIMALIDGGIQLWV